MQFACLNCGRTDEVIGDTSSMCISCQGPLTEAIDSYAGLLMSPEFVLRRMKSLVGKHGLVRVETGRFKHEREAWSTAIYALALSEMHAKTYWIEVETVENTPDTYVHHIDQTTGDNVDRNQSVEVVDWDEHIDNPMTLIRKKAKKAYPPHYCLLITGRSGKIVDPAVLAEQTRRLSVPFAEIWIIGVLAHNLINVARLYPTLWLLTFEIPKALEKAKPKNDILIRQQRGRGTEIVPLGPIYLPLP